MKTGQTFTETKLFTQADFDEFARLSGDDNPIHVNPAFAVRTRFGRTVAHGMFLYSVICGALNRYFPGAVQLEQQLLFPAPTFADERLEIRIGVRQANEQQLHVTTQILNESGALTCDGECVLAYG
ncbi:MAG: MaoC family dehydratase [Chloroflexi bacterium]|nr:MaoC family dehydratase [Chloroflexota bacterium]